MKRTMTGIVLVFFLVPALVLAAADPGSKDKVLFGDADWTTPGKVVVPIIIINDEPVTAIDIPLKFGNADDDITLARANFEVGRVSDFDFKIAKIDNKAKTVLIGLVSSGQSMKPAMKSGSEAVGYLEFTVGDQVKVFTINIDQSKAPQHTLTLIENRDVNGGKQVIDFAPDFTPGNFARAGVSPLPKAYGFNGNYPNPFNPKTRISFALPKQAKVSLDIYNILGQKVRNLINGEMDAGYKSVEWDGTDDNGTMVSSGIYLYKLNANQGEFQRVSKMTFLK